MDIRKTGKKLLILTLSLALSLTAFSSAFAKERGEKNRQACDNCMGMSRAPQGYEDLLGDGSVYRGGNSKSELQSGGGELDNDANDFADVLPYGNTYVDTSKLTWDNPDGFVIDIKDDRFVWVSTTPRRDAEGHTSTADPMGHGFDSDVETIAYIGEVKSYLPNTADAARTGGYTKDITPSGDYLYRITYKNAAYLPDGSTGDVVLTTKRVQIESSFTQDAAHPNVYDGYSYDKAILGLQGPNSLRSYSSFRDANGNYINTYSTVVMPQEGTQQLIDRLNSYLPDGQKINSTDAAKNSDIRVRNTIGNLIDLDIEIKDKDGQPVKGVLSFAAQDLDHATYQNTWGRPIALGGVYNTDFSEGMLIKEGALSSALVPEYNHWQETTLENGWLPRGPFEQEKKSPLKIERVQAGSGANGLRFSSSFIVNMRDKNGKFDNAMFAYTASNGYSEIRTAQGNTVADSSRIISNKVLSANAMTDPAKKEIYAMMKRDNFSGAPSRWQDLTLDVAHAYLGDASWKASREDETTSFDTGFAVLLDTRKTQVQFSGSRPMAGLSTTLFNDTLFSYARTTHGTGGGIYIENYDHEQDCAPVITEGGASLPHGGALTVTAVPEDGYRIDSFRIGAIEDDPSSWTKVDVSDLREGRPVQKSAGGKTYTFELNSDGTIDVSGNIDDPTHFHVDFAADFYLEKEWKNATPKELTIKAKPYKYDGDNFVEAGSAVTFKVNDTMTDYVTVDDTNPSNIIWKIKYPSAGVTSLNWPALPIEAESDHSENHVERLYYFAEETVPEKMKAEYSNAAAKNPGVVTDSYHHETGWYELATEDNAKTGLNTKKAENKAAFMSVFEETGKISNEPYYKVTYEWEGDHPNKTVPEGQDEISHGSSYDVDTTYKPGDTVVEPKDGVPGVWTFNGWDKEGTLTITEDTVIKGTWTFSPYVKVEYEWEGDHPDVPVPDGESEIVPGTTYSVDTTYKPGDTLKGEKDGKKGTWTFNGWDKTGDLVLNEDTLIKGTWSFTPEYDITTEAVNGTITETETDIPEGENRVITYQPNPGYQLKSLTVDGEPKDITEYPNSYSFTDIRSDHDVKVVYELIPALTIEKTAAKEVYNAGDTVTYTITVRQTVDGAEARNVTITDAIPEALKLNKDSIEGSVTVVKAEDNSYELSIESLTGELTYTYTAVLTEDADYDEVINVATVTASNVPDPAEDDAKVKSLTPKPTIEKIVSNENPAYGEEITYWIKVTEPQEGIELRNAHIEDPLPEGIEPTYDEIGYDGDEGEAEITEGKFIADIPALRTEAIFSFTAIVTATEGEVDNIATLTGKGTPPISDNALIKVKQPEPVLTKAVSKEEASVGDTVTYTITASSEIALKDAVIEDSLPDGIELIEGSVKCSDEKAKISVSEGKIRAEVETLKEAVTITYKAKITAAGEHINVVELTAYNYPNGPLKAEAKVKAEKPVPVIEKEVSEESVKVGESVDYTVTAYAETGTIYNAVITDNLPSGIELDEESLECSREDADVSVSGKVITIKLETLSKEPVEITYSATVTKAGSHVNTATLSGDNTDEEVEAEATVKGIRKPLIKAGLVKTGDSMPIWPFIGFGVAVAGLIAIAIRRRKQRDTSDDNR